MSSLTGSAERPERSRNAKAQARHRAKRKAYIEQLEQTVTKLQTALGASGDQLTAIPPPLARIRDLEQENDRLLKENEALHRMLQEANGGRPISMELGARRASPLGSFNDSRNACDRDYKRRKMETSNVDDYILNSYGTHSRAHSHSPPSIGLSRHSPSSSSHTPDPHSRPPPLSIPHHFHHGPTNHGPASAPPPLYGLGGPPPAFQMPHTPSGSSSTSSPPFSPATMHPTANSPVAHRPPPHTLTSYPSANGTGGAGYVSVKAEDDYPPPSHHSGHFSGSLPSFAQTLPDHAMENGSSWHYHPERTQLHR